MFSQGLIAKNKASFVRAVTATLFAYNCINYLLLRNINPLC